MPSLKKKKKKKDEFVPYHLMEKININQIITE